jgi:hypothetical protein
MLVKGVDVRGHDLILRYYPGNSLKGLRESTRYISE